MSCQVQLHKIGGRRIAKKRDAAGMSQEHVAALMHMSIEGYARYECGETPASLLKLNRLATIFQCGIDELIVETSTGLTAQAQRIANLLNGVSSSGRDEIVQIVENICALSHKKSLKPYWDCRRALLHFKIEMKQANFFPLRYLLTSNCNTSSKTRFLALASLINAEAGIT